MVNISAIDRKILDLLQEEFPCSTTPYWDLAVKLNIDEDQLIDRIAKLKQQGIIRRIGGVINAGKMGYYSTLCACTIPEEHFDEVIAEINALSGVTHNYLREHQYNVWFTLTGSSQAKVGMILEQLQAKTGINIISMPAINVYKIKVSFEMREKNEL